MVSDITILTLSPEELRSKRLSSRTLQAAVTALHTDGLLIFTNAVDPSHLSTLNAIMVPDARILAADPRTHHNFGHAAANIQQSPPVAPGLVFEDVLANPFVAQAVAGVLGPKPRVRFYSANTLFPTAVTSADATSGSIRTPAASQPVHIDPESNFPPIPFSFLVNVSLVSVGPATGVTELWPGTHSPTVTPSYDAVVDEARTGSCVVRHELVEARRSVRPPVRPDLPRGALIIRDFRLWHAGVGMEPGVGVGSSEGEPRVMLVTALFAQWYRSNLKFQLQKDCENKIDWGELEPCIEWVDEGYDYLNGKHEHDFSLLP